MSLPDTRSGRPGYRQTSTSKYRIIPRDTYQEPWRQREEMKGGVADKR